MGLEAPCDSWLTLASGLYLSPRTGEALRLGRATLLWMTNSGVDSGLVHYEKKDSNFDISPLQKLVTKQYKISDRFLIAELILGQCVQEAIPTCEAVSALLRTMSPNHNNCTTIYRTVWSHNTQSWLWNLHEISDGFVKIGYPEIHSFISCYIEFEFILSYFIPWCLTNDHFLGRHSPPHALRPSLPVDLAGNPSKSTNPSKLVGGMVDLPQIVDLPMKNDDLPMKNGDLPMKNGDLPMKNGDFPWFFVCLPVVY